MEAKTILPQNSTQHRSRCYTVVNIAFTIATIYGLYAAAEWKNRVNLANRQRPEGGFPACSRLRHWQPADPHNCLYGRNVDAAPQQPHGLACSSAQAAGAAAAAAEGAAAGHSAAQDTIELEPAYSKSE